MSVVELKQQLEERSHRWMADWHTEVPRQRERCAGNRLELTPSPRSSSRCSDGSRCSRQGWTLRAAEQVCAGGQAGEKPLIDLLDSLVDKCLVVLEERDGSTRYRMLETLRGARAID
jgi:hypothetical protein